MTQIIYGKSEVDTLLNNKQNTLTAGTGITIANDVISASGSGITAHTFNTYGELKQAVKNLFNSTGKYPIAYYLYEYLVDTDTVRRYIPCTMETFEYFDVEEFNIRGAYINLMYGEGYYFSNLYITLGLESGISISDSATSVDYYIFRETRPIGSSSIGGSQVAHTFQINKFILLLLFHF